MKTFAFTNQELTRRNGYAVKRVTLYRIGRYEIEQVVTEEYSFKDDGQAARELGESKGLFKPGERTLSGSHRIEYVNGFTVCGNARFKQI